MTARCTICHTLVQPSDATTACETCQQTFHASCWDELRGCATYGCSRAAEAQKPSAAAAVGAGWGDTKACPACGASIGSGLLICLCGAKFPYADPMTRADYGAWKRKEAETRGVKRVILALFLVSLLGLPSPATGATAAWMAWREKRRLQGTDGTYLAMGYGAAAVGATYTILFLLLLAGL